MELILKRIAKKKDYTIGRMFIRTECTEMTEGSELDASTRGGLEGPFATRWSLPGEIMRTGDGS